MWTITTTEVNKNVKIDSCLLKRHKYSENRTVKHKTHTRPGDPLLQTWKWFKYIVNFKRDMYRSQSVIQRFSHSRNISSSFMWLRIKRQSLYSEHNIPFLFYDINQTGNRVKLKGSGIQYENVVYTWTTECLDVRFPCVFCRIWTNRSLSSGTRTG